MHSQHTHTNKYLAKHCMCEYHPEVFSNLCDTSKMSDLKNLSITQMHDGLSNREFSAVELAKIHLDAIDNDTLNAVVTKTREYSLNKAALADKMIANGEGSILTGIPIGIKDNFCTKGIRTTACSRILKDFVPTYESTITQNLLDQGVVPVGKLNMDEFAMGSGNLSSYFGPAKNPFKRLSDGKEVVPGGSSGGSAAAVAANLCAAALGTDTGGSVRQPAALCGLVGIKPTYGLCSRWGMIAFASSLDQAGVLARNVEDCAIMLEAMSGYDPKDSTSYSCKNGNNYRKNIDSNIKGKTIGIPKELLEYEMPQDIRSKWELAISRLEKEGANVVEVSLPDMKYGLPVYYIVASAEASSNLSRFDGVRYGTREEGKTIDELYENTRSKGFGNEVKKRILIGTYVLSAGHFDAYYTKAQSVRRIITDEFKKVMQNVDAILSPTTPSEAFAAGEKMSAVQMYLNDFITVNANLTGMPAISIPAGLSDNGLPVGLQMTSSHYEEKKLFGLASALERLMK